LDENGELSDDKIKEFLESDKHTKGIRPGSFKDFLLQMLAPEKTPEEKEQYYNEVVFGDNAIDYEYYKQYYEQISPEYAEVLYKQVLEKYLYDERYKDLADAYATMKPKKAAAALYEMTGNLETVVAILQNIEVEARAKILDALSDTDAVFCAKITVMLSPQ
jgi:hypothetical protein